MRDAIIGLGLKGLRGMLLGCSLNKVFGPRLGCYGKESKTLWQHAFAVAAGAKFLTKQLPDSPDDADEIFVAGLLHDLGKLLLAPFLTAMGKDLTLGKEPVHMPEERLLGIDRQEAGGLIADNWNLKPLVRSVITHHHFKACPAAHRHAVAVDAHAQFLADDLATVGLEPPSWEETRAAVCEAAQAALAAS